MKTQRKILFPIPPIVLIITLLFGSCGARKGIDFFTPYNYGYQIELSVNGSGQPVIVGDRKHYTAGKHTPEQGIVMSDRKTVYYSDDGSFRGLFMFIADREDDLSSGRLYMARWHQTSGQDPDPVSGDGTGGSGDLDWVFLAHGSDGEIEDFIKRDLKFTDFFDVKNPKDCPTDGGFRRIQAGAPGTMCLRFRDGTGGSTLSDRFKDLEEFLMASAFLEPGKTGAWRGATAEFNKEEGMAYDGGENLYISMSSIHSSMRDEASESANHIRLAENFCGAVYRIRLGGDRKDMGGNPIPGQLVGQKMESILHGDWLPSEGRCSERSISNPDNLRYLPEDLLLIGEDTHFVPRNRLHLLQLKDRAVEREPVLTTLIDLPPGAETTGTMDPFFDQKKGKLYILLNAQHPHEGEKERNREDLRGVLGALVISDLEGPDLRNPVFYHTDHGEQDRSGIGSVDTMHMGKKTFPVRFQTFMKSGDSFQGGEPVGSLKNYSGNLIKNSEGSVKVSNLPDGSSILENESGIFLVNQFEDFPGAVTVTRMERDGDGFLKPTGMESVNFARQGGSMINCASTRTPWNTHLIPEEDYYFDAYFFDPATVGYAQEHTEYCEKDSSGRYTGRYKPEIRTGAESLWCGMLQGMINDYWETSL